MQNVMSPLLFFSRLDHRSVRAMKQYLILLSTTGPISRKNGRAILLTDLDGVAYRFAHTLYLAHFQRLFTTWSEGGGRD